MIVDKASHRTVRDAVEAVVEHGIPSMLEADRRPYLSVQDAKSLAYQLLEERGQVANVRLFIKGPWLHIEPFGHGEGPDAT